MSKIVARETFLSWIVHIFAVEGHDIVEHALGLDSWAIGVEFYGLDIGVDSLMPLASLASLVSYLIILFSAHFTQ